jgi:hypothetical protein
MVATTNAMPPWIVGGLVHDREPGVTPENAVCHNYQGHTRLSNGQGHRKTPVARAQLAALASRLQLISPNPSSHCFGKNTEPETDEGSVML